MGKEPKGKHPKVCFNCKMLFFFSLINNLHLFPPHPLTSNCHRIQSNNFSSIRTSLSCFPAHTFRHTITQGCLCPQVFCVSCRTEMHHLKTENVSQYHIFLCLVLSTSSKTQFMVFIRTQPEVWCWHSRDTFDV